MTVYIEIKEKSAEFGEYWDWNQSVSTVIKKGRLRRIECVKCNDNGDWVKQSVVMEVNGTRQRNLFPRKAWCEGGYEKFWPVPRGYIGSE